MGIVRRGAMHGFAALPSAIMGGTLRLPPQQWRWRLRRQLDWCGIHNGGWEGRKPALAMEREARLNSILYKAFPKRGERKRENATFFLNFL